jgi:hypothetical protein
LSPEARKRVIDEWRRAQGDPERVERFRRHALDILTDGLIPETDPEFSELSDDERAEYIAYVSADLGIELLRFLSFWTLTDLPMVDEWRRRERRRFAPRPR